MAKPGAGDEDDVRGKPLAHDLIVLLFPGFETIDAMGPVEMLGNLPYVAIRFASLSGGVIKSAQGVPVATEKWRPAPTNWLLVPGAAPQHLDLPEAFFAMLKRSAEAASEVMTVCTGSVLLARTGLLDGRRAATNKNAMGMAVKRFPAVRWAERARWVEDGKFTLRRSASALRRRGALRALRNTAGTRIRTTTPLPGPDGGFGRSVRA